MARRRRRKRSWMNSPIVLTLLLAGISYGVYYYTIGRPPDIQATNVVALTTDRPEIANLEGPLPNGVKEKGFDPVEPAEDNVKARSRAQSLVKSGREAAISGDPVTARAQLSEALHLPLPQVDAEAIRGELVQLADETIFSSRVYDDDPLVESYIIAPGDTLAKIAKGYHITPNLLARINDIDNPNVIRAGRRLKVIRGPFRAVVTKEEYRVDVYLDGILVRHFRVGLGAEGSTPTGEWTIANKLVNPVYYPPRGGQIIAADDPENPLGERWLGLEGVSGEAVGMERYGIHGTIAPEEIGQSTTLGCIRLYNEDVDFLFDLLVTELSKVVVK